MAFVDFADPAAPEASVVRPRASACIAASDQDTGETDLSPLEWRVVELARSDGPETLRPHRPRSWLGRVVFGEKKTAPHLANPRLEALRRVAVEAWWRGYDISINAWMAACSAGYTEGQIAAAITAIAQRRVARKAAA